MGRRAGHRHDRGAALIVAMLTMTLVASLSAVAVWRQWRAVEVEAAERTRQQAGWILAGALDWARLILREDARSGTTDHLDEPWAVPLREARLSSFLSSSGGAAGEALPRDAFLSGTITDAQARLNLRNLVDGGRVSGDDLRRFARLFEFLGLPQRELQALAENLRFALDASPDNRSAAQAPLAPQRVAHAEWLGLSPATRRALEPFVTWLPQRTPVNLNTAPAEVVMAALPGLDMGTAQRLVARRAGRPFATLADAAQAAGLPLSALDDGAFSVSSRFFEVRGQLRLDERVVAEHSLVQRDGQDVRTLWRLRGE